MLFKKKRINLSNQYLDGTQDTVRFSRLPTASYAIICIILAFVFAGTSLTTTIFSSGSLLAHAEKEDEAKEKIQEAADKFLEDSKEGEERSALFPALEKAESAKEDKDSFGYVLSRLFSIHYINDTSKGYSSDNSVPVGLQCSADNPHSGTPVYHNCDIPNILTELIQDFLSVGSQQGIIGGNTTSATLDASVFGLPQGIPADGAPVNPNERAVKYTALELYGYNLSYTTYNGEWDHIKVMTTARAMSNFGFMDDFKMGVTSVAQGVAGGVSGSAQGFMDGLSTGNFFSAVGGGFSGFWSGAASSSINSILDTSDHNVFATNAWYRVSYGGTLYNARELTETEMAARTQNTIISMLTSSSPDLATIPGELRQIKEGPPDPKEAISKCVIVNESGRNEEIKYGNGKIAPGVTEPECAKAAQVAFEIRDRGNDPESNDKAKYTWDAEGNQKLETMAQWKSNNSEMFKTADKYNLQCDINTNESARKDTLASFRICWNTNYSIVVKNVENQEQYDSNVEWLTNLFNPANISNWITGNHKENFNAPWNRYVCVDSKGNDILDSNGQLVPLYDYNGDLNEGCKPVRPPIQNGFFGNGYESSQKQPGIDTRYKNSSDNFLSIIFPIDRIVSSIGNVGLTIASFATRISNTVISLSYEPVLKTLGIDKLVVELIERFRESLFFPLITLFIGLAGVQIMWNVGRNKNYQTQAGSILMLCLTIIAGTILMFKPAMVVNAVDEVPSMVETAIMGSVFSLGNRSDDNLCHATGSIAGSNFVDLDGNAIGIGTNEGTRVLMCENWRTFAFNPWVRGQWGTDYSNLYAANSGNENTMTNTNQALVGNASVNMGGGFNERNWALYQLDTMSSGTAYFKDLETPTGRLDTDLYRIVDLQAGPNNGAGTDSRYFEAWSGQTLERALIGPLSAIVAIIGAITVISYSLAKIQIAFVMTMMLILLPFMFLFGIHPTMGRLKLKGYIGSIIGLMVQRIVLVTILAVLFRIVAQLGTLSENYLLSIVFTVAILLFFIGARKSILRFVFETISSGFGQPIGQQFMDKPKEWIDQNIRDKHTSGSLLGNNIKRAQVGATAFAGGAIGGYMSGGKGARGKAAWDNIKGEASKSSQQAVARLKNRQRHRGFGLAQTMIESRIAAEQQTEQRLNEHGLAKDIRKSAHEKTEKHRQYESELQKYESLKAEETVEQNPVTKSDEKFKIDADGTKVVKPEPPVMSNMATGAIASRRLSRQINTREKMNKVQEEINKQNLEEIRSMNQDSRSFVNNYNDAKNSDVNTDQTELSEDELSSISHLEESALVKPIRDEIEEVKVKRQERRRALAESKDIKDKDTRDKTVAYIKRQISNYNQTLKELEKKYEDTIASSSVTLQAQEDIRSMNDRNNEELSKSLDKDSEKLANITDKQQMNQERIEEMRNLVHGLVHRAKKD